MTIDEWKKDKLFRDVEKVGLQQTLFRTIKRLIIAEKEIKKLKSIKEIEFESTVENFVR